MDEDPYRKYKETLLSEISIETNAKQESNIFYVQTENKGFKEKTETLANLFNNGQKETLVKTMENCEYNSVIISNILSERQNITKPSVPNLHNDLFANEAKSIDQRLCRVKIPRLRHENKHFRHSKILYPDKKSFLHGKYDDGTANSVENCNSGGTMNCKLCDSIDSCLSIGKTSVKRKLESSDENGNNPRIERRNINGFNNSTFIKNHDHVLSCTKHLESHKTIASLESDLERLSCESLQGRNSIENYYNFKQMKNIEIQSSPIRIIRAATTFGEDSVEYVDPTMEVELDSADSDPDDPEPNGENQTDDSLEQGQNETTALNNESNFENQAVEEETASSTQAEGVHTSAEKDDDIQERSIRSIESGKDICLHEEVQEETSGNKGAENPSRNVPQSKESDVDDVQNSHDSEMCAKDVKPSISATSVKEGVDSSALHSQYHPTDENKNSYHDTEKCNEVCLETPQHYTDEKSENLGAESADEVCSNKNTIECSKNDLNTADEIIDVVKSEVDTKSQKKATLEREDRNGDEHNSDSQLDISKETNHAEEDGETLNSDEELNIDGLIENKKKELEHMKEITEDEASVDNSKNIQNTKEFTEEQKFIVQDSTEPSERISDDKEVTSDNRNKQDIELKDKITELTKHGTKEQENKDQNVKTELTEEIIGEKEDAEDKGKENELSISFTAEREDAEQDVNKLGFSKEITDKKVDKDSGTATDTAENSMIEQISTEQNDKSAELEEETINEKENAVENYEESSPVKDETIEQEDTEQSDTKLELTEENLEEMENIVQSDNKTELAEEITNGKKDTEDSDNDHVNHDIIRQEDTEESEKKPEHTENEDTEITKIEKKLDESSKVEQDTEENDKKLELTENIIDEKEDTDHSKEVIQPNKNSTIEQEDIEHIEMLEQQDTGDSCENTEIEEKTIVEKEDTEPTVVETELTYDSNVERKITEQRKEKVEITKDITDEREDTKVLDELKSLENDEEKDAESNDKVKQFSKDLIKKQEHMENSEEELKSFKESANEQEGVGENGSKVESIESITNEREEIVLEEELQLMKPEKSDVSSGEEVREDSKYIDNILEKNIDSNGKEGKSQTIDDKEATEHTEEVIEPVEDSSPKNHSNVVKEKTEDTADIEKTEGENMDICENKEPNLYSREEPEEMEDLECKHELEFDKTTNTELKDGNLKSDSQTEIKKESCEVEIQKLEEARECVSEAILEETKDEHKDEIESNGDKSPDKKHYIDAVLQSSPPEDSSQKGNTTTNINGKATHEETNNIISKNISCKKGKIMEKPLLENINSSDRVSYQSTPDSGKIVSPRKGIKVEEDEIETAISSVMFYEETSDENEQNIQISPELEIRNQDFQSDEDIPVDESPLKEESPEICAGETTTKQPSLEKLAPMPASEAAAEAEKKKSQGAKKSQSASPKKRLKKRKSRSRSSQKGGLMP